MSKYMNPRNKCQPEAWHADENCHYLPNNPKEISKTDIDWYELTACLHCVQDETVNRVEPKTPCPMCNEPVKRLPNHLPCDD